MGWSYEDYEDVSPSEETEEEVSANVSWSYEDYDKPRTLSRKDFYKSGLNSRQKRFSDEGSLVDIEMDGLLDVEVVDYNRPNMAGRDQHLVDMFQYDEETDSIVPSGDYGRVPMDDDTFEQQQVQQFYKTGSVDDVEAFQEGMGQRIDSLYADLNNSAFTVEQREDAALSLQDINKRIGMLNPDATVTIPEELIETDEDGNERLSYDAVPVVNAEDGSITYQKYEDTFFSRAAMLSVDVDLDDTMKPLFQTVLAGDHYGSRAAHAVLGRPAELITEFVIDKGGTVLLKGVGGIVDIVEEAMTLVGWDEREADEDLAIIWTTSAELGVGLFETMEAMPALAVMKTPKMALKESIKYLNQVTEAPRLARTTIDDIRRMEYTERTAKQREAERIVKENEEFTLKIVQEWEEQSGKKFTVDVNGTKQIAYGKIRERGEGMLREIKDGLEPARPSGKAKSIDEALKEKAAIERDAFDREVLSPSIGSETIKPFIAVMKTLTDEFPVPEGQKVSDWMFDRMVDASRGKNPELFERASELMGRYGIDYEDFTTMLLGSSSEAGRALAQYSQIARLRPSSPTQRAAALARQESKNVNAMGIWGKTSTFARRTEGMRRGALVGTITTHIRNAQSALIRSPIEGLTNVVANTVQSTALAEGGLNKTLTFAKNVMPLSENWTRSFGHMRYMLDKSGDARQMTSYILNHERYKGRYDNFFTQIVDIDEAFGRGQHTGRGWKQADRALMEMEDLVHTLNATNRWQDVYVRNAIFMNNLRNSLKVEWGIDFMEEAARGRMHDIITSAKTFRKNDDMRTFDELVADSYEHAMRFTYAAQPEWKPLGAISNAVVKSVVGTVVIPFPRFMFSAMELMANSTVGVVPAMVKMVGGKKLSDRDVAHKIGQNVAGITTIAAFTMYREESEHAGAKFNEFVSGDKKYNLDALFPAAQFALIADVAGKPLTNWLMGDTGFFDASEEDREAARRELKERYDLMSEDEKIAFHDAAYADILAKAARAHIAGEPLNVDFREIFQTITGTNFRAGATASVVDGLVDHLNNVNIPSELSSDFGSFVGTFVGEYAASFLQPLTVGVKVAREIQDDPDMTFYDYRPEPAFNFWDNFKNYANRPFRIKGFGQANRTAVEEQLEAMEGKWIGNMTDEERLAYEDRLLKLRSTRMEARVSPTREVAAKRGDPIMDLMGVPEFEGDTPQQFYLKRLGLDDFDIGSKSGFPQVDRQINEMLNDQLPRVVGEYMIYFQTQEREVSAAEQKAIIKNHLNAIKQDIVSNTRQGLNPLAHEYIAFKRKDPAMRGLAVQRFQEMWDANHEFKGVKFREGRESRDPNPLNLRDLITLNELVKAYQR